ncbi:hypothetical protein pb186bvf_011327 [Paramecium bursaria]
MQMMKKLSLEGGINHQRQRSIRYSQMFKQSRKDQKISLSCRNKNEEKKIQFSHLYQYCFFLFLMWLQLLFLIICNENKKCLFSLFHDVPLMTPTDSLKININNNILLFKQHSEFSQCKCMNIEIVKNLIRSKQMRNGKMQENQSQIEQTFNIINSKLDLASVLVLGGHIRAIQENFIFCNVNFCRLFHRMIICEKLRSNKYKKTNEILK